MTDIPSGDDHPAPEVNIPSHQDPDNDADATEPDGSTTADRGSPSEDDPLGD